jgi:PTH2 family peptidyl-tRNA hydrolase
LASVEVGDGAFSSDNFRRLWQLSQPDKPKQIICIRRDLHMRRGKEIAQGCHASQLATQMASQMNTPAYQEWMEGAFTKICVVVQSEEELLALAAQALAAGLPYGLIMDSGRTEFGGIPTRTALGIGPAYDHDLKPITGDLKLY